jgi:hypothetical protein
VKPAKGRSRAAVATALSIVLHAVFGVGLYFAPSVTPPINITYEFEVTDQKRDFMPPEVPEEPPPPPPPRKRPKPRPDEGGGPDAGADERDGGVPDGGPTDGGVPDAAPADGGRPAPVATKDLRKFAPGGARVIVLLRNDLVRGSPYRDAAVGLMRALPDWRSLVGDSDFDPVRELDAMLIATPNPYDVTATFLAARVKSEARAKREIKPRFTPGDTRTLDWPFEKLAVVARPEQHDRIAGPWLGHLRRFEQQTSGGAALYLTLQDLKGLMELTGGKIIRIPSVVELSMTAAVPAAVRIRLSYDDEAQAEKVREAWPWITDKIKRYPPVQLFGMATVTDSLTPRREGAVVFIEGNVSQKHVEAVLGLARMALLRQL